MQCTLHIQTSLLNAEDFWVFWDLYLQFIASIKSIFGTNALIWGYFCNMRGRAVDEAIEVKGWLRLNLEAVTSKFCKQFWNFGCQPRKCKINLCMTNGSKFLINLTLISFFLHYVVFEEQQKRQAHQNSGTVCLTFSRLAAKLSEMMTKFQGRSLKIQPWSPFDLNGLKNSPSLHFKNSLKLTHLFQKLMGGMNCR